VAPLQAPWPVVSWVPQSLEPCLAQSLVPQLAQRNSGQEEQSRHLLPQEDGRLQGQRNGALLLQSTARRKERRRLRSVRVRVEALRLGELHHEGGGSQRAHREVRRPYERCLSRACETASARGIFSQTVKTRLHRARRLLREFLGEQVKAILRTCFRSILM
jgi:hypothetical protein